MSGDGNIAIERLDDGIAAVGIDRPEKRNGFTPAMLAGLAQAYTELDADPSVRVLLLHGVGGHFTAGLDLSKMAASQQRGEPLFPPGLVDPLGLTGRPCSKPVVVATEGFCFTLGIELILASDITVAATNSRFAQLEVRRSIVAYGGATIRLTQRLGWGNAMQILLTGDEFDAARALRMGLVQEVVEPGEAYRAALAIAGRIAGAAPLAVQASLANARLALTEGAAAAAAALPATVARIAATEDAREGVAAFLEKRPANFRGV
jgi:enoyl-CoA hydratase/carnithine racemase